MRLNEQMHKGYKVGDGRLEPITMPFPLEKTTSIHVRHGDKAKEMSLIPFSEYLAAINKFVVLNPLGYGHSIFISTEDPSVIDEARNVSLYAMHKLESGSLVWYLPRFTGVTSPDANWNIYYSEINRLNTGPILQLITFGKLNTTYTWMLQLLMALECDAFVGTRGSNWNRLIDELRCVWVGKCSSPYFEVGPEKDWVGYNW